MCTESLRVASSSNSLLGASAAIRIHHLKRMMMATSYLLYSVLMIFLTVNSRAKVCAFSNGLRYHNRFNAHIGTRGRGLSDFAPWHPFSKTISRLRRRSAGFEQYTNEQRGSHDFGPQDHRYEAVTTTHSSNAATAMSVLIMLLCVGSFFSVDMTDTSTLGRSWSSSYAVSAVHADEWPSSTGIMTKKLPTSIQISEQKALQQTSPDLLARVQRLEDTMVTKTEFSLAFAVLVFALAVTLARMEEQRKEDIARSDANTARMEEQRKQDIARMRDDNMPTLMAAVLVPTLMGLLPYFVKAK